MASIDELEASVAPKTTELTATAPSCGTAPKGTCVNCEFCGGTETGKKWRNGAGQDELMRYCYMFLSFVPARQSFGCTLWAQVTKKGDR